MNPHPSQQHILIIVLIVIALGGLVLMLTRDTEKSRSIRKNEVPVATTSDSTSTTTSTTTISKNTSSNQEGSIASKWTWNGIIPQSLIEQKKEYNNGSFVLTLESNGSFGIQGDCNTAGGNYSVTPNKNRNGGVITFSEMISTLMYCEGSKETVLMQSLSKVTSYTLQKDTLVLKVGPGEEDILTFNR